MMIDFGVAPHIEAQATGSPGQRTFQLRILGEAGQSASFKLEKEFILGLRMGLYEVLAKTSHRRKSEEAGLVYLPPTPDYDFPVGQLGLGFSDGKSSSKSDSLRRRRRRIRTPLPFAPSSRSNKEQRSPLSWMRSSPREGPFALCASLQLIPKDTYASSPTVTLGSPSRRSRVTTGEPDPHRKAQ